MLAVGDENVGWVFAENIVTYNLWVLLVLWVILLFTLCLVVEFLNKFNIELHIICSKFDDEK